MVEKKGFIQANLHPGKLVTIWGKMGDGKSNFASGLIEKLSARFYHTYTNIFFFTEDEIEEAKKEGLLNAKMEYLQVPGNVYIVTKISELLKGLNRTSKHKKNVVILDEASLFAAGVIAKEKRVTWLKELITSILRKLNASIIIISQDKDSVVPMLREKLPSTELRVKKNNVTGERIVEIYVFPDTAGAEVVEPDLIDVLHNIPPSNLPYDSYAPAKFEFDLDFDAFLNKAGEYNSLKLRKVLNDIVDSLVDEYKTSKIKGERQISKKDLIVLGLMNGVDNRSIVQALQVLGVETNTGYIRDVKSKMGL